MLYYQFKRGMEGAIGYAVAGGWVDAQEMLDEIGVSPESITNDFFCVDTEEPVKVKSVGSNLVKVPFWTNCGRRWYHETLSGYMQPSGTLFVTEEEFEKRCL